jgi:preprotein translocase subunit SecD
VTFRFNPTGARAFGEYTAANVGAPFAIVLDNEVISAPRDPEAITGRVGADHRATSRSRSSTELAVLLRAGALPAEMTFLEERTIGPELGADSIAAGEIADRGLRGRAGLHGAELRAGSGCSPTSR